MVSSHSKVNQPHLNKASNWTYLHRTVEEAAVLSWLVQQAFGRGQGQHAPRLVGLTQIAPLPSEEPDQRHWITGSAFWQPDNSRGDVRMQICDPRAPNGATPEQSGPKLFPELQCYTLASSPYVQLILKGPCALSTWFLERKKKVTNSTHTHIKYSPSLSLGKPLMVCGLILGIRCLLKEGTLLIHPALLRRNLYVCLSEGLKHPSWQVLPHGPDFI